MRDFVLGACLARKEWRNDTSEPLQLKFYPFGASRFKLTFRTPKLGITHQQQFKPVSGHALQVRYNWQNHQDFDDPRDREFFNLNMPAPAPG
jgi:hypothetical protein